MVPSPSPRPPADAFVAKRSGLTDRLIEIVLAEGVTGLGLRATAARLGTSDRMLLYYFGTKAQLVLAVLKRISERFARELEATPLGTRLAPGSLLSGAWALFATPRVMPFMRVWAEITVHGARGEEPYRTVARQTIAGWIDWVDARLDLPRGSKRKRSAAAILTILEGAILLEMSDPGSTEGVGALLSKAMSPRALPREGRVAERPQRKARRGRETRDER